MIKPYLTYDQQIYKLVENKELIINDKEYARRKLIEIGYFSLIGGYKNLFINPMTRKYENDTTFEDVVALYEFDESLRQLTFSYLIKIEQKLRQLIAYSFCAQYGEQQIHYLTRDNYNLNPRLTGEIDRLINILDYHANRNTEKTYLTHQRTAYGNVPLWVTTKILTFGQLSKFYSVLQARQQSDISKAYEFVTEGNLGKYFSILTLFRNVCAHNERLFSFKISQRRFPDSVIHHRMNIPQRGNEYILGKNDYFGLVIAFRHLLPKEDFMMYKKELKRLLNAYFKKSRRLTKSFLFSKMGMPANWENIARYRLSKTTEQ